MAVEQRDELDPKEFPSIEAICEFVLPSYDWAVRRLDIIVSTLTAPCSHFQTAYKASGPAQSQREMPRDSPLTEYVRIHLLQNKSVQII